MPIEITIISTLLGLFIGAVLALTGAGGTILAIPLLTFGLNLSFSQASPIALIAILAAASIGALQGLKRGIVRYKAAMVIALVGVVLAPIGVKLSFILPQTALSVLLALVLFYIAVRTWRTAGQVDNSNEELTPPACAINPATSRLFWTAACTWRLLITGGLTGILSGLLGVGGGFVIVPSLKKVSNFNHATIIATTLAVIALVSMSALASHLQHTSINWQIAIPFIIATTSAMLLVSTFRHKIPNSLSQQIFAVLCLFAGASLFIKALSQF
jgi:uncharacterized protein